MNNNEEVVYLHLDDIIPNRFQPREIFDEQPLKELAISIKEHGVIQPIIVRKVNDKYEIIAGERRYKASALAGLTKIPAIVRDLDDKESSKVALLENLQRKNLNAIEEAKTYQKILELDEMTQEELAKTMGKSQSAVANKIRLLSLPDEVQEALLKDKISERHARALLSINDPEKQKELLNEIISTKMNVRNLESKIKSINGENIETTEENNQEPIIMPSSNNSNMDINQEFVSSSPLVPNFDGNINNVDDTPALIIPPKNNQDEEQFEENDSNSEEPKFINFGEISDDDDNLEEDVKDDEEDTISFGQGPIGANAEINIDNLKQNTSDLSTNNSNSGVNLDSLLQFQNSAVPTGNTEINNEDGFKFFSPAEEAIKESETTTKDSEDYFKAPDLMNVELPNSEDSNTFNTNTIPLVDNFDSEKEEEKVTINNNSINNAIDMIRNTLSKIEDNGIKVEKDEINLENSYQIVIKLEK